MADKDCNLGIYSDDQTWDSHLKPWFIFSIHSILMYVGYLLGIRADLSISFLVSIEEDCFLSWDSHPKSHRVTFLGHILLNSSFKINKYLSSFSHLMQYHPQKNTLKSIYIAMNMHYSYQHHCTLLAHDFKISNCVIWHFLCIFLW